MKLEDFGAGCTQLKPTIHKFIGTKEHKGFTEPMSDIKSERILKNVPQQEKCETFQMDKKYTLKLMYINLILYNLYHIKFS